MSSDVHIWHLLRGNDEKGAQKTTPNANNLVSLCKRSEGVGIVDCGLKSKQHGHHPSINLYNPRRKTTVEKQNSAANAIYNSYLSKVRWKDEQAHQNVWLAWVFSVEECAGDMHRS
eukprot:TRINITY_DN583_c0_g1_i1.p2 TRINITY_DN583_c0_g1~~TRINITY_DN583_c0_g1_i1.p2  ORF type:complete len:116 (-),score=21.07 TRINITY_DN583_c0_g1_i1:413-760(-)